MFVVTNKKVVKGKTYTSTFVVESYRDKRDGKIKKRIIANLSGLSPESIDIIRKSLKGHKAIFLDNTENNVKITE